MSQQSELELAKKKLEAKIKLQELMKNSNKVLKSSKSIDEKRNALEALGWTKDQVNEVMAPDYMGRVGFPGYRLTNNNAEINRLKEKVLTLEAQAEKKEIKEQIGETGYKTYVFDGGTFVVEEDRVRIYYDEKPSEEQREQLKRAGWKWSYANKAWQRYVTDASILSAQRITGGKLDAATAPEIEYKSFQNTENASENFEKKKFTFVSIYFNNVQKRLGIQGQESRINLVIFTHSSVEAKELLTTWLKTQMPSDLADIVTFHSYPQKYIRESKRLYDRKMYLPNPGLSLYGQFPELGLPYFDLQNSLDYDAVNEAENQEQSIPELISQGKIDLEMHKTTKQHAQEYGIAAFNPLYIKTICVDSAERLKGVGKKLLQHIDKYAIDNNHDVVFGHIAQNADFTKDSRTTTFCNVDLIKNWLQSNGYAVNSQNNDFHKQFVFSDEDKTSPPKTKFKIDGVEYDLSNEMFPEDHPIMILDRESPQWKSSVKEYFAEGKTPTIEISLNPASYKNQFLLNEAIRQYIESNALTIENCLQRTYTEEEKQFLRSYTGYGGLGQYDTESKADVLRIMEFYTPNKIIEIMWGLAYKNGYKANQSVFEPSAGTGEFLKYTNPETVVEAIEISKISSVICQILYPHVKVYNMPFEQMFIAKNFSIKDKINRKFDLVIGNPPYASFERLEPEAAKYLLGMGEKDYTKARNYVEYFLRRSIDLLNPGGLLVFIIGAEVMNGGQLFLDSGTSLVKEFLHQHTQLLESYRLPAGVFDNTNVTSEILVIKKL